MLILNLIQNFKEKNRPNFLHNTAKFSGIQYKFTVKVKRREVLSEQNANYAYVKQKGS